MMVLAWSITEVIRYAFYALNLFNAAPYILLWCRYTFFYILYPIGTHTHTHLVMSGIV